jgi:tetratricopeptide (TPR) repeat protein
MACVDQALRRNSGYWPALAGKVALLRATGEDNRALLLLFESADNVDHPSLAMLMAQLQMDLGFWADADESIQGFRASAPLLGIDRQALKSIDLLRAHIAYRRGQYALAADLYAGTDLPFAASLAARLRQDQGQARRRLLEVPWRRQHHNTCSPATLASICGYWQIPAEHLEIAEAICYDGTPAHSERRWAAEAGLVHRELAVDWPTAVGLIDRGIPFGLVTSDASTAHMQAVAGYDAHRKSFLCRDPSERQWVELDAETLLEVLAPTGPRGLVLLPPGEAGRLAGLELPDSELFDLYDRIEANLARHRRAEAAAALAELAARAPGHRLELMGVAALASYDGNVPRLLAAVEAQLARHPDFARFQFLRLSLLGQLGRTAERRAELEKLAESGNDPHFAFLLAGDLLADARQHRRAQRLIQRGLRLKPDHWQAYAMLAGIAESRGEAARSLRLHRFAACLAGGDEAPQLGFFAVCRAAGQTAAGLDYLERRVRRLGQRSGGPSISLAAALESLDRYDEALAAIEAALRLRPEDPELLLDLVGRRLQCGRVAEARQLLPGLRGRTDPAEFLSVAARLAEHDGDFAGALAHLEAMLELDPTSIGLYARIHELLAGYRGPAAGLRFLAAARERFPHHQPLAQLHLRSSREESPEQARAIARQLIELDKASAWAWRECADISLQLGELEEAAAEIERAAQLEPGSSSLFGLRGQLAQARGEISASTYYRQAIESQIDNGWALLQLILARPDAEGRRIELRWLAPRLARSVDGTALEVFGGHAQRYLPPGEALDILGRLHRERSDLWQSHWALARQLQSGARPDEALQVLEQALQRFPRQPGLWLALAGLHGAAHRDGQKREAWLRLLEIDPSVVEARLKLAQDFLDAQDFAAARHHHAIGLERHPHQAAFHFLGAEISRLGGDFEKALEAALKAIELDPSDSDDWLRLKSYARLAGREPAALAAARQFLERSEGDGWAFVVVARLAGDPAEARAAMGRALALKPRQTIFHLENVAMLREMGDLEGALAACRPAAYLRGAGQVPLELRGQAALILDRLGRRGQAVAALERMVDEDPDCVFAWAQLCDWHHQAQRWIELEAAAERLVAASPGAAAPWGYRGAARLAAGRTAEAVADFRRALEIDPGYTWAIFQLGALEEKKGAVAAFEFLRGFAGRPREATFWARLVQLAVSSGGHPDLGQWLGKLAAEKDCSFEILAPLIEMLATRCRPGLEIFDDLVWAPTTEAPLLEARLGGLVQGKGLDAAWDLLKRADEGSPVWVRGAGFLLELEIEQELEKGRFGRMARLLARYRDVFWRATRTWGLVGHYLFLFDPPRQAIAWLSDFRERKEVTPWHLLQLSCALVNEKKYQAACEVSRYALSLEAAEESAFHRYLVAWWEAMSGQPEKGRALALNPANRFNDYARLAKAAALVVGRRGDGEALDLAYAHLRAPSKVPGCDKPLVFNPPKERIYNSLLYHLARQIGGPRAWFFALLRARSETKMN